MRCFLSCSARFLPLLFRPLSLRAPRALARYLTASLLLTVRPLFSASLPFTPPSSSRRHLPWLVFRLVTPASRVPPPRPRPPAGAGLPPLDCVGPPAACRLVSSPAPFRAACPAACCCLLPLSSSAYLHAATCLPPFGVVLNRPCSGLCGRLQLNHTLPSNDFVFWLARSRLFRSNLAFQPRSIWPVPGLRISNTSAGVALGFVSHLLLRRSTPSCTSYWCFHRSLDCLSGTRPSCPFFPRSCHFSRLSASVPPSFTLLPYPDGSRPFARGPLELITMLRLPSPLLGLGLSFRARVRRLYGCIYSLLALFAGVVSSVKRPLWLLRASARWLLCPPLSATAPQGSRRAYPVGVPTPRQPLFPPPFRPVG